MTDTTIPWEQELLEAARQLDKEGQCRVLAYARALRTRPRGLSGKEALRIAREINFDPAELAVMQQAIEEEFERITEASEVNLDE
jgi:7,8-dihydro-6-hydroxymethylpterin-pyrophosphokinase